MDPIVFEKPPHLSPTTEEELRANGIFLPAVVHRDALVVDAQGRPIIEFYVHDVPGEVFLDPGVPIMKIE